MVSDDVPRLARIDAGAYYERSRPERDAICDWLRANGVDPNVVTLRRDVEVVLLDGPAIVREEYLLNERGRKYIDPVTEDAATRMVHSLLRVPLPDHLAD